MANQVSVCLTFDLDAMSVWIRMFKGSVGDITRGEFDVIGTKRLLDLGQKLDIPFTFCVPGHTAYCYPDLIRRIRDEGHEIACHGWVHENPTDFSPGEESANVERGLEAIERVCQLRPQGYRTPAWDFSEATVDILIDLGFVWESSLMAVDFHPFYPRTRDVASETEPYVFGELRDLVEVPASWSQDDFSACEYVLPRAGMHNAGFTAPSLLKEMWMGDFDYCAAHEVDGLYVMTMHPQVIGRGSRITMLEDMINHMMDHADTRFLRVMDFVKPWKEANPLEKWAKENPELSGYSAYRF